jgi:hypothetical protein
MCFHPRKKLGTYKVMCIKSCVENNWFCEFRNKCLIVVLQVITEVGEHHGDGDYVKEWWTAWWALRGINV